MAGAPVPDRPNIHSNRVPAPKPVKYVCFLGLQDNPEGIRINGPRRARSRLTFGCIRRMSARVNRLIKPADRVQTLMMIV